MSRSLLVRLLDNFFRHWPLYLLPVILVSGMGAYSELSKEAVYGSSGVMYIENDSLISQLTSVRQDSLSYETPAALTSRKVGSLLQTDDFVRSVADGAGVADEVDAGILGLGDIRSSISVFADGSNLVRFVARTSDPTLSYRLAQSTIDSFTEWVITANLGDSTAAERFFEDLIVTYRTDVDQATAALNAYLAANPEPAFGDQPTAIQLEIDRLTNQVGTAQARLDAALDKSEEARLASTQTKSDVAQRMQVVDEPRFPSGKESGLKNSVFKLAVYMMLGLLLSVGAIVAGTLLDHAIRTPSDVAERLDSYVLGVLPDVTSEVELTVVAADR